MERACSGLEIRFGFGHVFVLSGKDFGCRNALEPWNDAPAGVHQLEGKRECCEGSVRESGARRRYAREVMGVCLSFVSTEVSKWKGRHTETWICAAVHGRIGGRWVMVDLYSCLYCELVRESVFE